jgi:dihydroorotate dehydrogenase
MNSYGNLTTPDGRGRPHPLHATAVFGKNEAKLADDTSIAYRLYRKVEATGGRFLLQLPPEIAHYWAIKTLKLGRFRPRPLLDERVLSQTVFGLSFPNPIGMAAGLDKDAEAVDGTLLTGFGFCEVGTLTPRRQDGNPKPRVFRLRDEEAIINHFGFNNKGHSAALKKLNRREFRHGIVGVNLGANKNSADRISDYVAGIRMFVQVASYFVINVSSPNTPDLRQLQEKHNLDELLARVLEVRDQASDVVGRKPVLLKISPDVTLRDLDDIVSVATRRRIDGIIVCNTTTRRSASLQSVAIEGGLSGKPLCALATRLVAETYMRIQGAFPIIGAGGIDSDETAWQRIRAGATLIQLNTALVYHFLSLIDDIKVGLVKRLVGGSYNNISDIIGEDAPYLTAKQWPVN